MKIAILKERRAHETRAAGSPDTVKRFVALGVEVAVEKGAGDGASIPDQAFQDAGAVIACTAAPAPQGAALVTQVLRPRICRRKGGLRTDKRRVGEEGERTFVF